MPSGMAIGDRVAVGNSAGTVRYVGPVGNYDGEWVGVEWDDPTRGKHDGSLGGVRYFSCEGGPVAGSFVRPEKANPRVSLYHALRTRYQVADDGSGPASSGTFQGLWGRQAGRVRRAGRAC